MIKFIDGQFDIKKQLKKNKVVRWIGNKLVDMDGVVFTGATSYTLSQFLQLDPINYIGDTINISDIPTPYCSSNGVLVRANDAGTGWIWIQTPSLTTTLIASAGVTAAKASGWGRIFVSDIGVDGSYWYSDGIRFNLAQHSVVLFNLNSNIALTGQPISLRAIRQLEIPKIAGKSVWGDNRVIQVEQIIEKSGTADLMNSAVFIGNNPRVLDDAETNTGVCSMATSSFSQTEIGSVTKIRRISDTSIKLMSATGALSMSIAGSKPTAITNMPSIDASTTYIDAVGKFTPTATVADTALTLTTHIITLISAGVAV